VRVSNDQIFQTGSTYRRIQVENANIGTAIGTIGIGIATGIDRIGITPGIS
jgi:hypothetical protein